MNRDFEHKILREQVCLAMQQLPTVQGVAFIVAVVLSYAVRNAVPHVNILVWGIMILAVVAERSILYRAFRNVREGPFAGEYWKNLYLVSALISGIVWGSSAFIIFPVGDLGLSCLVVLVIASLSAATTVSHSSIKFGPMALIGPAMLPYVLRCAMEGGEFGYTVGLLIVFYVFTLLSSSFKHYRFITSSIALRFENLELLEEVQKINYSLCQEIAERKLAQETLQESEVKFRLAFRTSPDSINLNRVSDGMYTDINDGFTKMTGYTRDDAIGKTSIELNIWRYQKDRERLVAGIVNNGFVENLEAEFCGKDGRILTGLMSARSLRINQEDMVLTITRDITDRKKAEEEKKKLEAELFYAQKMESVGRLAGGVAHDFNNMLSVIIGRAEMALESGILGDGLRRNLNEILNAGQRSADLTRQLLAFARKQTTVPRIVDLNETISGMLKMLLRLIGEDTALFWTPGPDLWKVKIDPSQVDQVLINLVVNARDAISGAGSITVSTVNVVADDSLRAEKSEFDPGDYILLTVSDTGAGMSEEVCGKVFEPFFTTKELGKGTGLGLSTIYGIVKQNNGFIYVVSEQGRGTTFKIYLPRFEAKTESALSARAAGKRPGGAETILLVEDDEAILDLGKSMLETLGYTVFAMHAPALATALVEAHRGDLHLLITDVVMPEMNGRELAERLRAIRPGLKCLYMSGYTADVITHRGILDEGVNFIQKPFGSDDFAMKVRQVLDRPDTGK